MTPRSKVAPSLRTLIESDPYSSAGLVKLIRVLPLMLDVVEAAQALRANRFPLVRRRVAEDAELALDKALAALEGDT